MRYCNVCSVETPSDEFVFCPYCAAQLTTSRSTSLPPPPGQPVSDLPTRSPAIDTSFLIFLWLGWWGLGLFMFMSTSDHSPALVAGSNVVMTLGTVFLIWLIGRGVRRGVLHFASDLAVAKRIPPSLG
jgi:hypothetical protein